MQLPKPSDVELDKASQQAIGDVIDLGRKVDSFRPFSDEVSKKIQKDLLSERVFNTNAIEGSTLTYGETRRVLEAGAVVDVGKKREAQEALNLSEAFSEIQKLVDDEHAKITQEPILRIHKILLMNVHDGYAGYFRRGNVIIQGAMYQPPDPSLVPDLMDRFFGFLKAATIDENSAIPMATWVHWAIARIHPFMEGNGRMARLWQDLVLFRGHLMAAIIRQQERKYYYEALTSADEGDYNPLTQLIAQSVTTTLQLSLNACQETDVLKGWASKLVSESDARTEETRRKEYLRWKPQMEELRSAFERCAAQIRRASAGDMDIVVHPFDLIEQRTWESIRSGEGARRTWYFWLIFKRGDIRLRYCFFFGKHITPNADEELGRIPPSVCLLVSEQEERNDEAVRLDMISDSPISLREILVLEGKLSTKECNDAGQTILQKDIAAIDIAQKFMQEVFLNRLG